MRKILRGQPDQRQQPQRQQQQSFHKQAGQPIQLHLLAQQAIGTEAEGQRQGYPGQLAQQEELVQDGNAGHHNRHHLQAGNTLTEYQQTHGDVHQGRKKVAQAGLQHMAGFHGVDIDTPVSGNKHRAAQHKAQIFRLFQGCGDWRPAPKQGNHDRQEQARPDHPVDEHLPGRNTLKQGKVQGKTAPHGVGRQAIGHTLAGFPRCIGHSRFIRSGSRICTFARCHRGRARYGRA